MGNMVPEPYYVSSCTLLYMLASKLTSAYSIQLKDQESCNTLCQWLLQNLHTRVVSFTVQESCNALCQWILQNLHTRVVSFTVHKPDFTAECDSCNGIAMLTHVTSSRLLLLQVNVVVMRGVNDDEIADFVELTRDHAVNVRFIEYMPFDGNVWSDTKMVTYKQMLAAVQQRFPDELQRMQVSSM